jgi:cytochrome c biogenesis protein CcdA
VRVAIDDCTPPRSGSPAPGRVLRPARELLRAADLVDRERVDEFVAEVERIRLDKSDLAILCTGPWPPYSRRRSFGAASRRIGSVRPALARERGYPPRVQELLIPVLLLGVADSVNPVTISVAVMLAAGERPVRALTGYTLGTGLVYFAGGVLLALGPAVLLHAALHHHAGTRTRIVEIAVGAGALAIAAFIATREPESVSRRVPTQLTPVKGFLLGAAITVVDLPTALMYFGAIALVVESGLMVVPQIVLLAIFNLAYVLPLIVITIFTAVLGRRAERALARTRDYIARWGHWLLAGLTAASGVYLIYVGIRGLAR